MIPSAYKDGKLFSVLPSDGSGDFDVTRSTSATRVNKDGLIELMVANVPRLDYSEGGCPKLLLENTSTNLIPYSEDLTQLNGVGDITYGTNITALDGKNTAVELLGENINNWVEFIHNGTIGTDYTVSFFVKKGTADSFRSFSRDAITAYQIEGNFTADNLEIKVLEEGVDVKVEKHALDYYRVSITYNSVEENQRIRLYPNNTMDGLAMSTYFWGVQIEEAGFASSYIPTNGAIATRYGDKVGESGNNTMFNNNEGSYLIECSVNSIGGIDYRATTYSNSNNDLFFIRWENDDMQIFYRTGALSESISIDNNVMTWNVTESNKYAISYGNGLFKLFINGVKYTERPFTSSFDGLDETSLYYNNGDFRLRGKVSDVRYYNTELSEEELINLTN